MAPSRSSWRTWDEQQRPAPGEIDAVFAARGAEHGLLRQEFPRAFGGARVRAYGFPGRRQTRWIKGVHQLTVSEIRDGTRFADAVTRTAWPRNTPGREGGFRDLW